MNLSHGIHASIPMSEYLDIDAMSSGRLEWLAVSPRYYRYRLDHPEPDTDATRLGTALHTCLLEPDHFALWYAREPDFNAIGVGHYQKPRATREYRLQVEALEAQGLEVLTNDETDAVTGMAMSIAAHPHAKAILRKCPEREVTLLWDRDGRLCRGRVDLLGDGITAEVKTTRSLRRFSPFVITDRGYYRQSAWYVGGLEALGRVTKASFYIAVESMPPYDVGVFVLDGPTLDFGHIANDALLARLDECEASGEWPGMFPSVVPVQITDAVVGELAAEE